MEEAKILFENKKWARSLALTILGMEELSKIELIGQSFFYIDQNQWNKFIDQFQSHQTKLDIGFSIEAQLAYRGSNEKEFEDRMDDLGHRRNLNDVKQESIYVGFNQDLGGFVSPLDNITEDNANKGITILKERLDFYEKELDFDHNEFVDILKKMKKESFEKLHKEEYSNYQDELNKVVKRLSERDKSKKKEIEVARPFQLPKFELNCKI